jgi:Mg/Co/Ni transporter MgtE
MSYENEYKEQNRNEVFFTRRAGIGLIWAIVSLFLPLLFLLIPNFHSFLSTVVHLNMSVTVLYVLLVIITVATWAGGIVRCVWEMIKYHALLSGVGLFLLLVQPVIWLFLGFVMLTAKLANLDLTSTASVLY